MLLLFQLNEGPERVPGLLPGEPPAAIQGDSRNRADARPVPPASTVVALVMLPSPAVAAGDGWRRHRCRSAQFRRGRPSATLYALNAAVTSDAAGHVAPGGQVGIP